jgi:hypothetical protein
LVKSCRVAAQEPLQSGGQFVHQANP